jgi:hypothetical protein
MQPVAIDLDRNYFVRYLGQMLKGCSSGAACRLKKSQAKTMN